MTQNPTNETTATLPCEGCDGSGVRIPATPLCPLDVPPGYVVIERCDMCCKFPHDKAAAESTATDVKTVVCVEGAEHVIGWPRSLRPDLQLHLVADMLKTLRQAGRDDLAAEFDNCVRLATRQPGDEKIIEAAKELYIDNAYDIEIDDNAVVSHGDDGAFVAGWLWVGRDKDDD
jgi:hypothetical protein